MKRTRVYTHFYRDELAYRFVKDKFCRIDQIYKLTQISSISSSDLRRVFIISFADHPRDSSFLDLEILKLHHIHRCIIDSDLTIKIRFHPCRYSLDKFIINNPYTCTPSTMIFFSLYIFILYQYHEPKPHYFQWYS